MIRFVYEKRGCKGFNEHLLTSLAFLAYTRVELKVSDVQMGNFYTPVFRRDVLWW